jgi:hypothetical protein
LSRSTVEVPRLGALARWHAEIRAGTRRNTIADFDGLAAAACNEAEALAHAARGDEGEARRFMDRALLRLHGCFGDPYDGDTQNPGPGRRMMADLRRLSGAA